MRPFGGWMQLLLAATVRRHCKAKYCNMLSCASSMSICRHPNIIACMTACLSPRNRLYSTEAHPAHTV